MNKKQIPNPVGRPVKMLDGKRRNIYIDEESWQKARELGNGKPSEGIRKALASAPVQIILPPVAS